MGKSDLSTQGGAVQHTVLGRAHRSRIPTGGKIRPGIQELTRDAARNPEIVKIYEQGLANEKTFEQIGELIIKQFPQFENKRPLVPKNVPYFTVRRCDFSNPDVTNQILAAYGEDRGDGVRRLYRFPAIFPADSWEAVMPHELATWSRTEKIYWSAYSPDGRERHCMMHQPADKDGHSGRPVRNFGGRPVVKRKDNGGICNPNICPEYQARKCNLSGRFIFFIPGIKSVEAFEIPTNSFYALSNAVQRFEAVAFMRGGRLAGFLDDKRTPFYFSKKLTEVSTLDKDGRPTRVHQWLIHLDAPVDLTALIASDGDGGLRDADNAATALAGDMPVFSDGGECDIAGSDILAPTPAAANFDTGGEVDVIAEDVDTVSARASKGSTKSVKSGTADNNNAPHAQENDLQSIGELLVEYHIEAEKFDAYTRNRWGGGWHLNPMGRRNVLDELKRYRNDPQGLLDKIEQACAKGGSQ